MKENKGNAAALLPILVFLLLYLGLGILFEYVLKINMGFYSIPIVVIFLIALLVAFLQTKSLDMNGRLSLMGQCMGDRNIVTMVLIFMEAGVFTGVVGRGSAESVAYFLLDILPGKFAVAVLFLVACFVSVAMGTSVGTVMLITPIAASVSAASGFSLPMCVGSVIGGAMFGDNLSFISDTTIAACNGQGCDMKDKFRENFAIALPAAIGTLALILAFSLKNYSGQNVAGDYKLLLVLPYLLVLILGILGVNVFLVLLIGIVTGSVIVLASGTTPFTGLLASMGDGVSGMYETTMVALLVAAICGLIRENGGFTALLGWIYKTFRGKKGGQLGMGLLVGALDIATANNTVAIVIANPIARNMAEEYGVSARKTASLLDTFSCILQGILPYGAQMLVALAAVKGMGTELSAFEVIPTLFYPFLLLLSSLIFIFVLPERKRS